MKVIAMCAGIKSALWSLLFVLFLSQTSYAEDVKMNMSVSLVQCGAPAQIEKACAKNAVCCVFRDRLVTAQLDQPEKAKDYKGTFIQASNAREYISE